MKNGVVSSHSCFSKEFVFSGCSLRQWTRVQKGRTDAPLDLWLNIGWRDPHLSFFFFKKFNQKSVFKWFPSDVVFWNTNWLVKLSISSYRAIQIQGNHLERFEYLLTSLNFGLRSRTVKIYKIPPYCFNTYFSIWVKLWKPAMALLWYTNLQTL